MAPSIFTALLAGVLSFLSPCILPLVPVYLGVLSGHDDSGRSGLRRALFFVAGFALIFVLLGLSAWAVGRALLQYRTTLSRIGGVVVILFGLYQIGLLRIPALQRERRFHMPAGGTDLGAFLIGLIFAFSWTPCVGPVLAGILAMAGSATEIRQSITLLAAYSAGLALPFLLAAVSYDLAKSWFKQLGKHVRVFEILGGVLLLVLGLLLVTGQFESFLRFTP